MKKTVQAGFHEAGEFWKRKKRDFILMALLLCFFFGIILWLTKDNCYYGSKIDWNQQHWAFPEYFRNLFYETGQLFPNFAFHLGAGQNIYNFAYYGLFSPMVLLSYLFPMIGMRTFITVMSIVTVAASILLFYIWARKRHGYLVSFFMAVLFETASPLIFHSHRHIMFISYMPFLLLGMFAVDYYRRTKKGFLLTLCVFLIVLCNFYFAISALIVLGIYAIYDYLHSSCFVENTSKTKAFLVYMAGIVWIFLNGVMMGAILLLPTLATLLAGRSDTAQRTPWKELFLPYVNLGRSLYSHYSLGLTGIFFIAVFYALWKGKAAERFLGILFLLLQMFPIFIYCLNGTLYVNAKVMIPFLPLAVLLIGELTEEIFKRKLSVKPVLFCFLVIGMGVCVTSYIVGNTNDLYPYFFLADAVIVLLAMLLYRHNGMRMTFVLPLTFFAVVICFYCNLDDEYVEKHSQGEKDIQIKMELEKKELEEEEEVYRFADKVKAFSTINRVYDMNYLTTHMYSSIYSRTYKNFFYYEMNNEIANRNELILPQSNNILFNLYMGEKYMFTSKDKQMAGYHPVAEKATVELLKNEDVLPIGYVSYQSLSREAYEKLTYPYKQEALFAYTVLDESENDACSTDIQTWEPDLSCSELPEGLTIRKCSEGYLVHAEKNSKLVLSLNEPYRDKILFIDFNVDNGERVVQAMLDEVGEKEWEYQSLDTTIEINKVRNRLTADDWKYNNGNTRFTYSLCAVNSLPTLDITFSAGTYLLSEWKWYSMKYQKLTDRKNQVDAYHIDKNKTAGDIITGEVSAKADGIFQISIPYDEGFSVYMDGIKTDYQKVDTAFIGFPITKGSHTITLSYTAPLQREGKWLSLAGIMLCIICLIFTEMKMTFRKNKNS